jgi:anion-transporting  ArsA/GET3 family ATPase
VTSAAPGVIEFVVLEHLLQWTEPGRLMRRAPYDVVIVDGPASGHAVRWLRTPRQLARLVPAGPIGNSIARLQALVEDARRTRVALVAIPEEMAVTELIETRRALRRSASRWRRRCSTAPGPSASPRPRRRPSWRAAATSRWSPRRASRLRRARG